MLLNEEASTCSQTNAAKHPADIVIHLRRFISGRVERRHWRRQSGNRFASKLWETKESWQRTISASRVGRWGNFPIVERLQIGRVHQHSVRSACHFGSFYSMPRLWIGGPRPAPQHVSNFCETAQASRNTMVTSPRWRWVYFRLS